MGYGGGVLLMNNSTVKQSYATEGGGIALVGAWTANLTNSIITQNEASFAAGGLFAI